MIAMDLCLTIEEWSGKPVGPASSVREALDLLSDTPECRAAIVDVNLPDGDIGPVLDVLKERGAAVVVSTGFALPPDVQARHPDTMLLRKPTPSKRAVETLIALMAGP
ncbi:response regulator [Methylocystis echinoides]|uniref:response regulator n=1 Tax=Methylocystis echinoides TaxID=29468 RepID=UPI00386216B1